MKNIHIILVLFVFFLLPKQQQAQTVILQTDTVEVNCTSSDTFLVPVKIQNFNNLGGIQFTIEWDTNLSDYIHIQDFNPLLLNGFVNMDTVSHMNKGQFTFAWLDPSGLTIPNTGNNTLFNIAFVRLGGAFSPVAFDTTALPNPPPTAITISNNNFAAVPFELSIGGIETIDPTPPTITCPASVTLTTSGPTPVSNIGTVALGDNCDIAATGWASTGATVASSPFDPNASGTVFNVGTSTVTYTTQDFGGNTATCTFTVQIDLDPNASDSLTFIASSGSASCGEVFFVDVTANNFDSIFGAQFSLAWQLNALTFDSVGLFNTALSVQDGNFNLAPAQNGTPAGYGNLSFGWNSDNFSAGSSVPDGTVLFRVYFSVGNASNGSTAIEFGNAPASTLSIDANLNPVPTVYIDGQFSVDDNTPPTIQCPANQTVSAIGQQNATVTGLEPVSLTDNCSGTVALTYTPTTAGNGNGSGPANGTYPSGNTTVTYTATDLAGNTATCSFTVSVDLGSIFELQIDSIAFACGGPNTITVPFRVRNFADIAGMNFSMQWDPAVLSYTGFSNAFPGMGITGASFPSASSTAPLGYINFLSVSPSGNWPNIPDNGIIFSLNFTVLNPNASTNFAFAQPLNAINGSFAPAPFDFIDGFFQSVDNSGPVVTCPANQTVPGNANCTATVVLPSATATDACGTVAVLTNNAPQGNVYQPGPTVVTFTATDDSGNTGTCSMTVTVNANTALTIPNCPTQPLVVQATQDCSAALQYPTVAAVNPCVTNANFVYNYNFPVGTVRPVGTTNVVITATQLGNGGGVATCTFQVQIVDAAAPVLTCPADITIDAEPGECYALNPTLPAPTVTDNCDQNLTATIDADLTDTLFVGVTNLIYLATDDADNVGACDFNVTVRDDSAPVLDCPADFTLDATANCNAVGAWEVPTVTDNCTAPAAISVSSNAAPGDIFGAGDHVITYEAVDEGGNIGACSFVLSVQEVTPPQIAGCPNSMFMLLPSNKCDTIINWIPPTATDNCGIDTFYTNIQPGSVFPSGTTTVIYTAVDSSGNVSTCTFDIAALDEVAPVFVTFPNDITVNNADPCGVQIPILEPTASDNCDPDPEITYSGNLQGIFPIGVTKIEFLVVDASGNTTKDTLTITVNAIQIKSFTNIPPSQTFTGCSAVATWTTPAVQGFCDQPVVTSTHNSGDTFGLGTTVVTYTATEANGSIITATFSITVTDPDAPQITCPQPVVVTSAGTVVSDPSQAVQTVSAANNCQDANLALDLPTVTDNCDQSPELVQVSGPNASGVFPAGTQTLVYQATDEFGNTSVCSYTVNVLPFTLGTPSVDPNPGCEGETVVLTVPNFMGATYTWTGPNGPYGNSPTLPLNNFSTDQAGDYAVSAVLNGCTANSGTVEVMIATKPVANDDLAFSIGIGDTLTANSVLVNDVIALPSDIQISLPNTIDGLTFNLEDGTFTYIHTGDPGTVTFVYEICSIACPDVCDMATVTIRVNDNNCDFIPNIFTPNNDNVNDLLVIPCLDSGGYPNNTLVIYNQWGDKVFEAKGYENTVGKAWNGTLNNEAGKDLPDGVYYYIFKQDSNAAALKGFVHIYR